MDMVMHMVGRGAHTMPIPRRPTIAIFFMFPPLETVQDCFGWLGNNLDKEPPGKVWGRSPRISLQVILSPSALGRFGIIPNINGHPVSGSHPHQSIGEVH